jgi:alkanesulfonate monooxygenase SsuD/methylene tetrahydromethanopterin reductase-like flavin-dependent oxidoreductase (luciferase family)
MGGLDEPPRSRLKRFREYLRVVKGLMNNDTFYFEGEFHRIEGLATMPPRPAQRPRPPLLVGATYRRALALAAQEADIVSIAFPQLFGSYATLEKDVRWIREAAGPRFATIELNMKLTGPLPVGMDRQRAARVIVDHGLTTDERRGPFEGEAQVLNTPENLLGTVDQAVEHLVELRERFDISYFSYMPRADRYDEFIDAVAPVVKRLSGT